MLVEELEVLSGADGLSRDVDMIVGLSIRRIKSIKSSISTFSRIELFILKFLRTFNKDSIPIYSNTLYPYFRLLVSIKIDIFFLRLCAIRIFRTTRNGVLGLKSLIDLEGTLMPKIAPRFRESLIVCSFSDFDGTFHHGASSDGIGRSKAKAFDKMISA